MQARVADTGRIYACAAPPSVGVLFVFSGRRRPTNRPLVCSGKTGSRLRRQR